VSLLSEKGQRISDLSRGMEEEDPWLAYEINELIDKAYGQSKVVRLLKTILEKKEQYMNQGNSQKVITNREKEF